MIKKICRCDEIKENDLLVSCPVCKGARKAITAHNPFFSNLNELRAAIDVLERMIPSNERKELAKIYYTKATEMVEANRIEIYLAKIKSLTEDINKADEFLDRIASMCGIPDSAEACRKILEYLKTF